MSDSVPLQPIAQDVYAAPQLTPEAMKAAAVKRHYKRVRSMQLPKKLY